MRNKILFLLLLVSFFGYSQPGVNPTGTPNQITKYRGGTINDSIMVMPIRNHTPYFTTVPWRGRIQLNKDTDKFEYSNSSQWVTLLDVLDLAHIVPYEGATANLDMGSFAIKSNDIYGRQIRFTQSGASFSTFLTGPINTENSYLTLPLSPTPYLATSLNGIPADENGNIVLKKRTDAEANFLNTKLKGTKALLKTYSDEKSVVEDNIKSLYDLFDAYAPYLSGRITKYDNTLKAVDASMGKYQRNVGNYAIAFNPLSNSINQLTRETPAFANSVQTGFMAISNNLPIFFDAMQQSIAQQKELQAQGQPSECLNYTINCLFRCFNFNIHIIYKNTCSS